VNAPSLRPHPRSRLQRSRPRSQVEGEEEELEVEEQKAEGRRATTMFQSFAIFALLVAAQAEQQQQYAANADAAAELQATETAATPFGSKQLIRCRQSCYQQVSQPLSPFPSSWSVH